MGRFVGVHIVELFCVADHKAGKTERLHGYQNTANEITGKSDQLRNRKICSFLRRKTCLSCLVLLNVIQILIFNLNGTK